jgi:hypothetical protein
MDIVQMHVWFRQYAQQMGMQNVRALLPEQIDILINTSISDTVNQILAEHVALTNDRVVTDNSKLGQINSLRTLQRVQEFTFDTNTSIDVSSAPQNKVIPIAGKKSHGAFRLRNVITDKDDIGTNVNQYRLKGLFITNLDIDYKVNNNSDSITLYYPVRIIDNMYLADTLQDYVLAPRVRTPIAVLYNNSLDIYLGKDYGEGNGLLKRKNSNDPIPMTPNNLRVSYIKTPNKVLYAEDIYGVANVDCDLPESLHVDILKRAVDLYNISLRGSIYTAQQQQQRQAQEATRNAARPDNEGYQQQ